MLTLNDGRSELWQWDTGRTLAVDADCSQVHFSNKVFGRSIDVDVIDGSAIIPDVLLQTDKDLNVWAFVGTAENGYTKISKTFRVNRRNKPADYVFTPVEQTTIAEIAAIAQSVRDDADAGRFDGKDGTSATHSWNGTVLTVTSASGTSSSDLKGDKGDKGDTGPAGKDGTPGADGKTPVYGVDYGTPEQISGIAQQAADILQPEVNQIKSDLSNKLPKSPANWEQWTIEEQAAARERIGVSCDFELIETINVTESINKIERFTDLNGEDYYFKRIYVSIDRQSGTGTLTIKVLQKKPRFSGEYVPDSTVLGAISGSGFGYADADFSSGIMRRKASSNLVNQTYVQNAVSSVAQLVVNGVDNWDNIKGIRIQAEDIGVGSTFIIYGVRA